MKKSFIQSLLNIIWKTERKLVNEMKTNITPSEVEYATKQSEQKKKLESTGLLTKNAENDQNKESLNSEIIKQSEYDMFTIIETEHGAFVALGNNRISELCTKSECIEKINNANWNLIFNMICVTTKAYMKIEEETKLQKQ